MTLKMILKMNLLLRTVIILKNNFFYKDINKFDSVGYMPKTKSFFGGQGQI